MAEKHKRGRPRKVVSMSEDEAMERLARATTQELMAIEHLVCDLTPSQWASRMLRDVRVMLAMHQL